MNIIEGGLEEMSNRARLQLELGPLLKKSLRLLLKGDESSTLLLYNEIDRQLSGFFERHPDLDIEVDVRKIVGEALSPHVNILSSSAKTLQNMISSYGSVVKGKMLSRDVVVRSKGRATLSMFPPGTRLRVTELRRGDGSLGGVQLIVKE